MKKIYTIIICFVLFSSFASAQINTAIDTNGKVDYKLFPEDENGKVAFVGKVDMDSMAVGKISETVNNYLSSYIIKYGVDKKSESVTSNAINYRFEVPIGKEHVNLLAMGSPVVSFARDISHVTFNLSVKIIDGRFKYTLDNFWTDRRMIHGEAKNDGEPNVIHWQRVNSLRKERESYASNKNTNNRKVREVLYDYDLQINKEMVLYDNEYAAVKELVDGLTGLSKIEDRAEYDEFGDRVVKTVEPKEVALLDLSNFHGNLLDKGNNVFITAGNPSQEFEWYGVAELKKQITVDSQWNIVDSPKKAHFILTYFVDLEGRDHAYAKISSNYSSGTYTTGSYGAGENSEDNREAAKKIYKSIYSEVSSLAKGKTSDDLIPFDYQK